jgi:ABC-type uncharacterized transport system permease subunit
MQWMAMPARSMLVAPSLVALAGYGAAALRGDEAWQRVALLVAWLAQAVAILADVAGWGDMHEGARFGFAPALSATVWMVLSVYALENRFRPYAGVRRVLALLGVVAVLLALEFPGEFRTQAGSPWAPVHWVLGLASYGLFGAAVLHAAMLGRAEHAMRSALAAAIGDAGGGHKGLPLLTLEKLTFRFVAAGFIVLSAALALGWWFATPWRWDHKTVFSVLGWAVFAALLGGRRRFGWRGPRATRWLYVGAGLLLLAYVGSRFVMEVLLHRTAVVAMVSPCC